MSVNYRLVSLNLQSAIFPDENTVKVYRIFYATFLFFVKSGIAAPKQRNVIKKSGYL
jgi:hypothetical protein